MSDRIRVEKFLVTERQYEGPPILGTPGTTIFAQESKKMKTLLAVPDTERDDKWKADLDHAYHMAACFSPLNRTRSTAEVLELMDPFKPKEKKG